MIFVFTPSQNTPGINPKTGKPWRDWSGAFRPAALGFKKVYDALGYATVIVEIDTSKGMPARRKQVLAALSSAAEDVEGVAFCCHGWRTGMQLGFNLQTVTSLAREIARTTTQPFVVLYACSTASGMPPVGDGPGGDGGFADVLRDKLCAEGAIYGHVDGHTREGEASQNPFLRRFEGAGSSTGGHGGYWLVTPGSALWPRWKKALQGSFRFEFPTMSIAAIHAKLA